MRRACYLIQAELVRHLDSNWPRPLRIYMALLLDSGLLLRPLVEPERAGGDPESIASHRRVPYFHIIESQKRPRDPWLGSRGDRKEEYV
jgi:hypothetical protein